VKTNEKVIKSYYKDSKVARSYDRKRFLHGGKVVDEAEKMAVLKLIKTKPGLNVLDVATGTGRFAIFLAGRGCKVNGLDSSDEMLAIAKRAVASENINVEFVKGDASDLPFSEDSFDVVVCMRLMIHTDNLENFLKEFSRVSKCSIIFDTVNKNSLKAIQVLLSNLLMKPLGLSYLSMYSEQQVIEIARKLNLSVKARVNNFLIPPAFYLFLPLPLSRLVKSFDDFLLKLTNGKFACAHTWLLQKHQY
jgi:ubiquinone/menaquinone biosynthesis C-methylase UbiE